MSKLSKRIIATIAAGMLLTSSMVVEAAPISKVPLTSHSPMWYYTVNGKTDHATSFNNWHYSNTVSTPGVEYIKKNGLNTYLTKATLNLEQCLIDNPDLVAAGLTTRNQVWDFLVRYDNVSPRIIHSTNVYEEYYCLVRDIAINIGTYNWNDNTLTVTQKCEIINNYLCNHYEYDDTYTNYDYMSMMTTGVGVCSAYTSFFDILASVSGINTGMISGDHHIWNAVQCEDGHWYEIDVTWNDCLNKNAYFMIRDHYSVDAGTNKNRGTEMSWWITEDLY